MKKRKTMKIILKYQAPETKVNGYKFSTIYDGWILIHDEDAESVL